MPDAANVFGRYEFAVRRLHSLLGIVPVGAFLAFHLVTNASILDGPATFQQRVAQIHDIGDNTVLAAEWLFIFLPILAHGAIGLVIVTRGKRNFHIYPYPENFRYALERWTGVITFAFILWHVFQTRGWITNQWWVEHVTHRLGGGTFDAKQAAVTATASIQASLFVRIAYLIGILASVYHFSNGLWTFGITWGIWTTPRSQRWALMPCLGIGLVLAIIGLAALVGMITTSISSGGAITALGH
jgi:succinate dehydrogenase / fumarate reductase cytochrome b subunit